MALAMGNMAEIGPKGYPNSAFDRNQRSPWPKPYL